MFEKFGEMSSCREINELAENLLNEGDIQNLKVMAQENGIPEDYVEMYQSGDIPYLCDAVTAAMGKLDVECGSLKLAGLMNDWVEYIRGLCMEDEMVAHQVRKKGKSLKANNDVLDGIRLVGMLLNLQKIVFASSCKETIKEFASYIWDEKALERGEDKPVKQFDHCCDAVRYLCSTIIGRKAARFREIRR